MQVQGFSKYKNIFSLGSSTQSSSHVSVPSWLSLTCPQPSRGGNQSCFTMTSQGILLSKHPGYCLRHGQPWRDQLTPGRYHHRSPPQDGQTWDTTYGEGGAKNQLSWHKAHPGISEQGLKHNCHPSPVFTLRRWGECSAQNLLLSASLCLEAEEAFAE